MTVHQLKTVQPYFNDVKYGRKLFELRKNDRDYRLGDIVNLLEYDPAADTQTGRNVSKRIVYILRDAGKFGLKPGYVILGLKP